MRKILHLMSTLNDEELEWLVSRGQVRFIPSGGHVIRHAEPIDALLILLEGQLSVRLEAGDRKTVATLYPGEVLGEISFVDERSPSASVVALTDSHVFMVRKDVLLQKLTRDDGFAARFYRAIALFLADRLRKTTANLGYGRWEKEDDGDEISDAAFDGITVAARRFDDMLHRLRINS